MLTEEFSFNLPKDLIAQNPVYPRDSSRMMCLDRSKSVVSHLHFSDIVEKLGVGDVLVFNQSKVIPARILFRAGGRDLEILLVRKHGDGEWLAMVRPGRVFMEGSSFCIDDNLSCKVENVLDNGLRKLRFVTKNGMFDEYLQLIGKVPLPPYIKNSSARMSDYQTVYATQEGSVAAPTAGLHFSEQILDDLRLKGVQTAFVTLHIGPGTFLPVKSENIEDHKMHSEWYEIDARTTDHLNKARDEGKRIIAVGTTAVRVLESNFFEGRFHAINEETDIFISPGYSWKCVDGLLTNFHLPKSSLLMLVCSFGGTDFVMNAYREAVDNKYRFFSFGDAMLIV